MRLTFWLTVALAAATPLVPAAADGMIDGGYRGDARRPATHGGRFGVQRHGRPHGRYGRSYARELAPHYGAHPPFYIGAGHAAPAGPVLLAEYSEPYIGRGLIYNVAPNPFFVSGTVVRAKY